MNNKFELARELYADNKQPVFFFDSSARLLWHNNAAAELVSEAHIERLHQICLTSDVASVLERLALGDSCQTPGNLMLGLGGVTLTPCFANDNMEFIIALISGVSGDQEKSSIQELVSRVVGQYNEPIFAIHNMLVPLKNRLEQFECYQDCSLLRGISQSCYKTMRFTSNISNYFCFMDPNVKMELQMLDINESIGELCYFISRLVSRTEIKFEYLPCEEHIVSKIDLKKLAIAVLNLVANSCLYTAPGNKITVKLTKAQNDFVITVADRGIGMPPEVRERAFEPFYSFDPNDSPASGVGLGLTLVKQVAELHGGICLLTSESEEGTTVAIKIPIVEGSPEMAVEAPEQDLLFSKFSPSYLYLVDICKIGAIDSL